MHNPYQHSQAQSLPPALPRRNILIRIFAAIFWLIIIYLVVQMATGAIIGGIAGAKVDPGLPAEQAYAAGAAAGEKAVSVFMHKHGLKLLLAELLIWITLTATGKLPWVSKYRH